MRMDRRGLTVIGLVGILVAIGIAIYLVIRFMGADAAPEPSPLDSAGAMVAPVVPPTPGVTPGGGTALASRLAVTAPIDSAGTPGDTIPLRIRATTETGTAVAQAVIRFAVTAGQGRLVPDSAVTNDIGEAEVRWVLGSAGPQTVRATLSGSDAVNATATVRVRGGEAPGGDE